MGSTHNRRSGKAPRIFFSWEKELSPEQRRAVETINGPLLVLAGAGSGKTRVIACRIAYLIASRTVGADKILALTFTNKAASEMRTRILNLIRGNTLNLWIGTFHSIFARILRREAGKIGFTSHFSIYDEADQLRAIKDVIEANNLVLGENTPLYLLHSISNLKSKLINHTWYAAINDDSLKRKILAPVYTAYAEYLKSNNAMDFDDLLLYTYQLFKNHPSVLKSYQNRFRYILVDEFQDTNLAQHKILLQLADKHHNICVVGDDDQSIYRWRGAEIKNILQFEHDFPNTTVIRLEQNYRSTKNILDAANSVIRNNRFRHAKELRTAKGTGEKITIHHAESDRDEAHWVARSIESEVFKEKWNWGDFGVLYRLNAQSRLMEDNLRSANIPYTIVGGLRFYERKEVKDVLAYLSLVVNPRDTVSLKRIINYPHRGLGKQTLARIEQYAAENSLSLFNSLKCAQKIPGIPAKRSAAILAFYKLITKYRKLRNKVSMVELVSALIEETQILEQLQLESGQDAVNRVENVRELLRAIDEYAAQNPKATIENYLAEIALLADIDTWDNSQQHVSLMTLHSAKGLEFPVVYITGLEEEILPIRQALEDPEELEEERRLFYVGATRAKDILHLSSSKVRVLFGKISEYPQSRFLSEIDKNTVFMPESDLAFTFHTPHRKTKQPKLVPASQLQSNRKYMVGVKVKHPDFGIGIIKNVEGSGNDAKLKIMFEVNGLKNLMARKAQLTIVET